MLHKLEIMSLISSSTEINPAKMEWHGRQSTCKQREIYWMDSGGTSQIPWTQQIIYMDRSQLLSTYKHANSKTILLSGKIAWFHYYILICFQTTNKLMLYETIELLKVTKKRKYIERHEVNKWRKDRTRSTTYNLLCCLQSVPINVLGNYDLTSMTLEYRRECQQSNLLESLTSSTVSGTEDSNNYMHRRPDIEFTHLLRMLADKAEIVRARTQWHSKQKLNWCDLKRTSCSS